MTESDKTSPGYWMAVHERIAAEWAEAGRGVDRRTQVARVEAARARRAAAVSEARIKAAVDKAVTEALASAGFAETVDQFAQASEPVPAASQVPERPLHEMSSEEWETHRSSYWAGRLTPRRRPMTIGEFIAGGRDDGEV